MIVILFSQQYGTTEVDFLYRTSRSWQPPTLIQGRENELKGLPWLCSTEKCHWQFWLQRHDLWHSYWDTFESNNGKMMWTWCSYVMNTWSMVESIHHLFLDLSPLSTVHILYFTLIPRDIYNYRGKLGDESLAGRTPLALLMELPKDGEWTFTYSSMNLIIRVIWLHCSACIVYVLECFGINHGFYQWTALKRRTDMLFRCLIPLVWPPTNQTCFIAFAFIQDENKSKRRRVKGHLCMQSRYGR